MYSYSLPWWGGLRAKVTLEAIPAGAAVPSRFNLQARPGVLGVRYLGPFYFRYMYMVFFDQNSGIKYLVFPEL